MPVLPRTETRFGLTLYFFVFALKTLSGSAFKRLWSYDWRGFVLYVAKRLECFGQVSLLQAFKYTRAHTARTHARTNARTHACTHTHTHTHARALSLSLFTSLSLARSLALAHSHTPGQELNERLFSAIFTHTHTIIKHTQ